MSGELIAHSIGSVFTVGIVVQEMVETIFFASVTGVGLAIAFSMAILGVTKSADYASDGRMAAAILAGVVGAFAVLVCLVGAGAGIYVMTQA